MSLFFISKIYDLGETTRAVYRTFPTTNPLFFLLVVPIRPCSSPSFFRLKIPSLRWELFRCSFPSLRELRSGFRSAAFLDVPVNRFFFPSLDPDGPFSSPFARMGSVVLSFFLPIVNADFFLTRPHELLVAFNCFFPSLMTSRFDALSFPSLVSRLTRAFYFTRRISLGACVYAWYRKSSS